MSLSAGIVTIFGKFCGGTVLSMMATARAIGAGVPAIFIVFNPNAVMSNGIPNLDYIKWYFYGCSAPLITMGVFLFFLNPYPIVKETDLDKLYKDSKEKKEVKDQHKIDF